MVGDIDAQIREIRELAEETNRLVKKLDRRARWATAGVIIKWLVYIGIIFGTFVFIQPYLEAILGGYLQVQELLGNGSEPKANGGYGDLIKGLLGSF